MCALSQALWHDKSIPEKELPKKEYSRLARYYQNRWEERQRQQEIEREFSTGSSGQDAWLKKKIYLLGKPFVERLRISYRHKEIGISEAAFLANVPPQYIYDLFEALD